MNTIDFVRSSFILSDFLVKGRSGTRNMIQNSAGGYYYDLYSTAIENCSYVLNTLPMTQVQEFSSDFYTRRVGTDANSSVGVLLTFSSGGYIVFDKDFTDPKKFKVYVVPSGTYGAARLDSSLADSYPCENLTNYPQLSLTTWNYFNVKILNQNSEFKYVTLKINNIIIYEGLIDFKSLSADKFLIGIHNYNNDLMTSNISIAGDDSPLSNFSLDSPYLFWRISRIQNRRSDQPYRSIGNLKFITEDGLVSDNPAYGISQSEFSNENSAGKAFDGLSDTYSLSAPALPDGSNTELNGKSWWIGYKFQTPCKISQIDLNIRFDMGSEINKIGNDSLGQEWTSFLLEGSEDGVTWYPSSNFTNLRIFKNDVSTHSYVKVEGVFQYVKPPHSGTAFKFWRVNNLDIDFKTLTSSLNTTASEIEFKNVENIEFNNLNNSFCTFGTDPDLAFDRNLTTKSTSISHFLKAKDYSIGCMFDSPVEVTAFKYNYNPSINTSKWISGNIEYSPDGFDWYIKGYCNFESKESSDVFPIKSKNLLTNKAKFWRLTDFTTLDPSGVRYNSHSYCAGLRFNTLGGAISNLPKKENLNYGLYYSDISFSSGPYNSFSSALNLTVNQRHKGNLVSSGQNDYYTFTVLETASVRIYSEGSLDMYGYLYNSSQTQLGADDDSGGGRQFQISSTLNPGRYYVMVRHYNSTTTGEYSIVVQLNSGVIGTPNKDIIYEFEEEEYVNTVSFVSNSNILYASLESSSDGTDWNFQGYLNFNLINRIANLNFSTLVRDSKNFLEYFSSTNLNSLININIKPFKITAFQPSFLNTRATSINIYTSDNKGIISGEVTELDIPVIREVGLYDRSTRQLIAITWSDEKGQYKFTGIDSTRKYYVHAIDSNDFYNAVTQDMIEPLI